jgi:general secretion pathway protein H
MTGPTYRTNDRRGGRGGFTLIELMMALAIMALIAALALPRVYPSGGATAGRSSAYAVAAVLRKDRTAALASGIPVTTRVDAGAATVTGGSGGTSVTIPKDLEIIADGLTGGGVTFQPDGTSTGGSIVLRRGKTAYSVLIQPLTGGVQIATGAR